MIKMNYRDVNFAVDRAASESIKMTDFARSSSKERSKLDSCEFRWQFLRTASTHDRVKTRGLRRYDTFARCIFVLRGRAENFHEP